MLKLPCKWMTRGLKFASLQQEVKGAALSKERAARAGVDRLSLRSLEIMRELRSPRPF